MNDPEAELKVSFDDEEFVLSWRRKEATTGQKALLFEWGLYRPARYREVKLLSSLTRCS